MNREKADLSNTCNGRILIVEDNDLNRKLAREILRLKGYQTSAATTGEEAVELALRESFDLILMDIQLPGMDGISAAEKYVPNPAGSSLSCRFTGWNSRGTNIAPENGGPP